MLVLTRKKGDSIRIGDEIEIKVLAIEGDNVKLGVVAPRSLPVYRHEIYEAIKSSNLESAEASSIDLQEIKKLFIGKSNSHTNHNENQ
ncbi:carbon storage regulator CsrA [Paenibacillus alginolyticus]|uniref:Translational regulator CsrA n=1 Tax=Paenibacillus alginolyticus TaxID=59839 RepID=A0ABT4GIT8_9BACL|nr:carbon storage regulator CsrA [Paenibacillus alginolyticus]MCY9696125.1 carbon storage regulator CsrA [Paenibacillus alginolyticus]MEC0143013.1 carbon storage regulator CsrA [Paenibacillus alginolyticus]